MSEPSEKIKVGLSTILAISAILISIGSNIASVQYMDTRLTKVETKQDRVNPELYQAQMKNLEDDMADMKQDVKDMKQNVKEIEILIIDFVRNSRNR